jgi:hypothetical protein
MLTSVRVRQEEECVVLGQIIIGDIGRFFGVLKVDPIAWTTSSQRCDRNGDRLVSISSSIAVDKDICDIQAKSGGDERKTQ